MKLQLTNARPEFEIREHDDHPGMPVVWTIFREYVQVKWHGENAGPAVDMPPPPGSIIRPSAPIGAAMPKALEVMVVDCQVLWSPQSLRGWAQAALLACDQADEAMAALAAPTNGDPTS